jgi:pantoate--beta-alanine ligase
VEVVSRVAELRARLKPERDIALVPTMGNLHEGHLALVELARRHGACVVVSIFVNPLQFGPREDLAAYPRTFAADCEKLEKLKVDVVFAPSESELYPTPQQVTIEPPPNANELCGAFRPGHFRGVMTVVLKLFNIVGPRVAVLGKKDYQQLHVLREMVRQLNLAVEIVAGETVRSPDGLALSSRNQYLNSAQRSEAVQLFMTLSRVKRAVDAGSRVYAGLARSAAEYLDSRGWRVDYVALRNSDTLTPAADGDQRLVVLGAAWLGETRLIDNLEIFSEPGKNLT